MSDPKIGLVLGGGGARGLGHIPVIEALDELGLSVTAIAGTSIGAIMGAARAGGLSGAEIRERTVETFGNRTAALARLWSLRPKRFGDLFAGGFGLGQIDPEKILDIFVGDALPPRFADCRVPFAVVATDFYGGKEVVLRDGDLRPAVAASIALPTIFKPVILDGAALIDGGVINPVPVDALPVPVDIVIAVDVVSFPEPSDGKVAPGAMEAIVGATQLLMQQVAAAKFEKRPPDILIRPPVNAFHVLDFLKARQILAATEPAKDEVKRKLARMIEAHPLEPVAELPAPQQPLALPKRSRRRLIGRAKETN